MDSYTWTRQCWPTSKDLYNLWAITGCSFIPFPMVLVLCEMQLVSSRIWTRVAVSISYDDNHYTTGTSIVCEMGGKWPHRCCFVRSCKDWGMIELDGERESGKSMLSARLDDDDDDNLQICGIKYSYLILIIFKQIYLTHRWDTNRYYHSESNWTWE